MLLDSAQTSGDQKFNGSAGIDLQVQDDRKDVISRQVVATICVEKNKYSWNKRIDIRLQQRTSIHGSNSSFLS